MAGRPRSRRGFLAAAGLAALGGCGSAADDDGRDAAGTTRTRTTRRRTTTRPPTPTATPTSTATPTPRPEPRFEPGPGTCTLATEPAGKTWPLAGYDAGATRNPPAASAPNSLPVRTAWTVPTAGTGPVLVDGERYFLRTPTALVALDPGSGRVRWRRRAAGPAGGVAVGEGIVALPTRKGCLLALDPSDGSERWRVDAGVATAPPLLTRDAVVLGTGAGVSAYARRDGTTCFRVSTARPASRLVRVGGLLVAATARPESGTLVAVDPGRETVRYARYLTAPPTGLLAVDGRLAVGVGDRTLALVPDDGTPRWTAAVGPVVAAGRHRYALGEDRVVALDDGGEVAWRATAPDPTGVAATEDIVVVTGGSAEAALQVHDARTGDRRLRVKDRTGFRSPAVADDRFLVVGGERTHVLEEAAF